MMDHLSLVPFEGGSAGVGGGGGGGKYKECMRNHAAAMGGQAFDGCGEYMPASPDSLKCAACGCHRSFHRRTSPGAEASAGSIVAGACAPPVFFRLPPPQSHHAALQGFLPSVPPLALPYHAVPAAAWHHAAAAARAGSETPPRLDDFGPGSGGGTGGGGSSFVRKRFRTKFTPEQKERMREFAEKQGWRINRNDDGALERFCLEIGVKRHVLKVWMHNHKNQLASSSTSAAAAAAGMNSGAGLGTGVGGDGGDDDDDTDDSPPRTAVSSPSPSPISVQPDTVTHTGLALALAS